MIVLLDQDRLQPVQVHLNELTRRVTVLFASIALLTAVWVMVVDEVLDTILLNLETMCRRLLERLRPSAMERRPMVDIPVVGRAFGTPPHRLPCSPILKAGLVAQRIHIATTMDDHHRFCPDRGCLPACSPRPACTVRCGIRPTQQGRTCRSIQRH